MNYLFRQIHIIRAACPAFTLIELLMVVAIIAILAAVAVTNMREATERSLKAANAANLHTISVALQAYTVDHNTLPPADAEAGPFSSVETASIGNGPAAGGSLDGLPWCLVDLKYISSWQTLFCPKYLRLFAGGKTIRGNFPRYHNFRYAYNSSSLPHGGHEGGSGIMTGTKWLVRDLGLGPEAGWYWSKYPEYPADYNFPWGDSHDQEQIIYSDFAIKLVKGGTDELVR